MNVVLQLKFVKVDVDANEAVAAKAGIRAIPTFQFFREGVMQSEVTGADVDALRAEVRAYGKD